MPTESEMYHDKQEGLNQYESEKTGEPLRSFDYESLLNGAIEELEQKEGYSPDDFKELSESGHSLTSVMNPKLYNQRPNSEVIDAIVRRDALTKIAEKHGYRLSFKDFNESDRWGKGISEEVIVEKQ